MTSIILSAIGLILAIAVFIILCMKGTGAIFASVIATMIIAVTANGGFTENFFTVFMTGTMGIYAEYAAFVHHRRSLRRPIEYHWV